MRFAIFVAVVAAHIALLWLFPTLRRVVLLPAADELAVTPVFLPPLAESMMELPLESAEQEPWEAPLLYRSAPASADQAVGPEPMQQHAMREAERVTKELRPAVEPQATSKADAAPGSKATPEANATPGLKATSGPEADLAPKATSEFDETPVSKKTSEAEATSAPESQLSSLLGPPSSAPEWRAQAHVTAQANSLRIVEAEDNVARQAAALTARFRPLPGPRVRGPEFGWDYAATHRITRPEGGGLLIAFNDRCAIFILLLPMIGCSIGPKPPANGDLFKYMHKPVKFGDWDWRVDDP
jgi:hypothetical protein